MPAVADQRRNGSESTPHSLVPSFFHELVAFPTWIKITLDSAVKSEGMQVLAESMLSGPPHVWLDVTYLKSIIDDANKPPPPPPPHRYPLFPLASKASDFIDLTKISNVEYIRAMHRMASLNRESQNQVDYALKLPQMIEMPRLLQPPSDYTLFLNFHPPMSDLSTILSQIPPLGDKRDIHGLLRVLVKMWDWAIKNFVSPLVLRQLIPTTLSERFVIETEPGRLDGYQILYEMANSMGLDMTNLADWACEEIPRLLPKVGLTEFLSEALIYSDYLWFNSRSLDTDAGCLWSKKESFRRNIDSILYALDFDLPPLYFDAVRIAIDRLMLYPEERIAPASLAARINLHFHYLQRAELNKSDAED